jgi:hypothetical protein
MLAKLGELNRPVPSRPAKNPGAAWGSTCHYIPWKERPNMVLEVVVLHQGRSKAEMVPLGILWEHPSKIWDSKENLLGIE